MRTREQEVEPLINLSEITEVELIILKRMREFTIGDHASMFHGTGFDYVGLRDWQAGDQPSQIDWAQSSLTNFSPMVVREFEQPSTASVLVVADRSASTRCGVGGVPIAHAAAIPFGVDRCYGLLEAPGARRRRATLRGLLGDGKTGHGERD